MALVMTQAEYRSTGSHSNEPMLSVAAVARRLGIAPATLRTWDRRYGLGPSDHTTGRHRKYGPRDVARLELMQRALLRGASSAEAARFALSSKASLTGGELPSKASSGGRGLKMPGASRLARGLGRAALAMDSVAVQQLLADALSSDGVIATWDGVIRPVLTAVAARWELSGAGVEVEHLLNECVAAALIRATPIVPSGRNHRPVLLACMPDERHTLSLHALAAELASREIVIRQLGAALPLEALAAAVRRTAPSAVVLWAQLPRYADPGALAALPRTRQQMRLFVGGPGWRRGVVPAQAERVEDLGAAVAAIEAAVV
ncbi:MerR family transcriptional regulator [Lentzea sp. NBRC 105346]|uniref:MerR family transcriptional regulator n=1 Tax=Lentzea sp. NBRC 105346 TaxID=3032205 RepID=UPI002557B3D7|nr:MerR family transcriptional regulator [Lentzea sp. NBRC 105346]GLZ30445.1 MerR family transcriptional regulator [Lentzea sp. NBRC 105346]